METGWAGEDGGAGMSRWTGTVPLGDHEYDVEAILTIIQNSDGDSDVPYGTRRWLEIDNVKILTAEDEDGNAVEGKDEALAEWIQMNADIPEPEER